MLDPEQHQARLQQHAQAMAVAQQHLRHQQEQECRLGLPNGLDQEGPHAQAANGQPADAAEAAAAADEALVASEAMQLEAAAFVESALADPSHPGSGSDVDNGGGRGNSPGPAASGGSSAPGEGASSSPVVPPTLPDQQPSSLQQPEQHQSAAGDVAARGVPADSPEASGPASMDIDAAAPEQQRLPQQPEAQQPPEAHGSGETVPHEGDAAVGGAAVEPQHDQN